MFKIIKATIKDAKILSKIGKSTFLVSHGHSASKADINNYIETNFSESNFLNELENPKNLYFLISYNDKNAGYSKIVLNSKNENIASKNTTLLSRIYLLEAFYGLNLGKELFNFIINFSKKNNQEGIWLAVWIENKRAINFYKKMGFKKIGNYDFKISETHSNPNHILYLSF